MLEAIQIKNATKNLSSISKHEFYAEISSMNMETEN